MSLLCPACSSSKVRLSRVRSLSEKMGTLAGVYPMRCEACRARFKTSIWRVAHLLYAKCPRCHRMDLAKWSEKYYRPTAWMSFKIAFGGKHLRCEYCRHNFVGFRPVRERFSWHKRAERSTVRVPVENSPGDDKDGESLSTANS